jgi:hypothetical protein
MLSLATNFPVQFPVPEGATIGASRRAIVGSPRPKETSPQPPVVSFRPIAKSPRASSAAHPHGPSSATHPHGPSEIRDQRGLRAWETNWSPAGLPTRTASLPTSLRPRKWESSAGTQSADRAAWSQAWCRQATCVLRRLSADISLTGECTR